MDGKIKHDFAMFVTGVLEMDGTPLSRAAQISEHARELGMGQELAIALICVAVQSHTMRQLKRRIGQTTGEMQGWYDSMLELTAL